jgi:hypothetical protein
MTDSEIQVVADATLLRAAEDGTDLWGAVDDELVDVAFGLSERGILAQRWHGSDPVFRLTDGAFTGYALSTLTTGDACSPN